MKKVCNYTVIQFQPYPETGEFVNIGVALITSTGEFHHKIEMRKSKRVTDFFYTLDKTLFTNARAEINQELDRIESAIARKPELAIPFFKALISPRETMIRFQVPGSMMIKDGETAINYLFDHYVNLSFATKEYEQQNLERQVGKLLEPAHLKKLYKDARVGTSTYSVRSPFVRMKQEEPTQAIKPLDLTQEDSTKILDQGAIWMGRLETLNRHKQLPEDTIIIVSSAKNKKLIDASMEVVNQLSGIDHVRVIDNSLPDSEIIETIKRH